MCRGKEFRQDFSRLGTLRSFFDCPVIALTATSPLSVTEEIEKSLHMSNTLRIKYPLDRKNIYILIDAYKTVEVSTASKSFNLCISLPLQSLAMCLEDLLRDSGTKTIVYVQKKAMAIKLWLLLHSRHHLVAVHHSSLTEETKRRVERDFRRNSLNIVIATIGFGLVSI